MQNRHFGIVLLNKMGVERHLNKIGSIEFQAQHTFYKTAANNILLFQAHSSSEIIKQNHLTL